MVGMTTPDPTPLTQESEALLDEVVEAYQAEAMGTLIWGDIPSPLRVLVERVEAAVTARVLADVAARLPEALKALALASNLGADYDADSILEALRNA